MIKGKIELLQKTTITISRNVMYMEVHNQDLLRMLSWSQNYSTQQKMLGISYILYFALFIANPKSLQSLWDLSSPQNSKILQKKAVTHRDHLPSALEITQGRDFKLLLATLQLEILVTKTE